LKINHLATLLTAALKPSSTVRLVAEAVVLHKSFCSARIHEQNLIHYK
jgi:hypothetical protein